MADRLTLDKLRSVDIVVAGCGPAGALAAVLLSRQGHRVLQLRSARSTLAIEGLGRRVLGILTAHGLRHAAAAAGPLVHRQVRWGVDDGARNSEFVTERARLDAALARDVDEAGVPGITVDRHRVAFADGRARVQVRARSGGELTVDAGWYVEARGRAAPRHGADGRGGPETIALVREIAPAGAPRTAVESFADGWAWFVSTGERAILQAFVDGGSVPNRSETAARFEALRGRLPLIREVSGGARGVGPVTARNSTARVSSAILQDRSLRIGDAALAIDPLSGHGVFEALGSALAAVPVVNTMLAAPERAAAARRFCLERADEGFLRNARIGRDFYRLEDRFADQPFWRARRHWPDDLPAHAAVENARAEICVRPVVADGLIAERRVVVTPDRPRGVWQVDGIAVAELLDVVRKEGADAVLEAAERLAPRFAASPAQLRSALGWLARGGLIA